MGKIMCVTIFTAILFCAGCPGPNNDESIALTTSMTKDAEYVIRLAGDIEEKSKNSEVKSKAKTIQEKANSIKDNAGKVESNIEELNGQITDLDEENKKLKEDAERKLQWILRGLTALSILAIGGSAGIFIWGDRKIGLIAGTASTSIMILSITVSLMLKWIIIIGIILIVVIIGGLIYLVWRNRESLIETIKGIDAFRIKNTDKQIDETLTSALKSKQDKSTKSHVEAIRK